MLPCGEVEADSKGCRPRCPLAMRPGRGVGSRYWQGPQGRAARLEVWPCLRVGGAVPTPPYPQPQSFPGSCPDSPSASVPACTEPGRSLDSGPGLVSAPPPLLAPCRQRALRGPRWGQESGGSGCARASEAPHSP